MPLQKLEERFFPPVGSKDAVFPPVGRKDAALFSRASTFQPLIDGPAYFAAIKAAIGGLRNGDACYIAGWALSDDFQFADGQKLGNLLANTVAAGVDVRVIVWANRQALKWMPETHWTSAIIRANVAAAEHLRAYAVAGEFVLANRVLIDWSGSQMSSHHMKVTVVVRGNKPVAFIGVDYLQNRMSAPMHRPPQPRPANYKGGFHEVGVEVTGDAALAALDTFATRWREASTLSPDTYDLGRGELPYNPSESALVNSKPPWVDPVNQSAETSVQVVRSFPAIKEYYRLWVDTPWETLPADGVHEVMQTFQTALGAARNYIYIEDQRFDAQEVLFPLLVKACHRGVKVIAVIPGQDDPSEGGQERERALPLIVQRHIVEPLKNENNHTNVTVWQLNGIFVHSKVILIDDEFVSLGSANFMDRSMKSTSMGDDSELSVAAVSTGRLVSDLRVNLWAEHMRMTDPGTLAQIRDLNSSLAFWREDCAWGNRVNFAAQDSPLRWLGPR
jgi:phosphatidylserine/phosphatidylglycerophosphate/cardiolipin synthase-like enzyme